MKSLVLTSLFLSLNLFAEPPRYMKACEEKKVNESCTFTSKKSGLVVTDTCRDGQTPKGEPALTCGVIKPSLKQKIKSFFK